MGLRLTMSEGEKGGTEWAIRVRHRVRRAKRRATAVYSLMLALGVSSIVVSAQAADVANVDDARIIENAKTGKEWLTQRPRLWRQQVQSARSDHGRQCRETGPCLVLSAGLDPRRRSDPDRRRRDHVCHRAVEHRIRDQRQDRRKDLDVRFPIAARQGVQAVLRRRQSWRRGLQGQGLRRHARRALDRPRRGDRQSALER